MLGFVPFIRERSDKRFYEKRCSPLDLTTLSNLSIPDIQTFTQELLLALFNLHQIKLVNIPTTFTDPIPEFPVFHSDIKPPNLLVFPDKTGKYHIALLDLGGSKPFKIVYSGAFLSPGQAQILENTNKTNRDILLYNQTYGQLDDIWSLGITLATIASRGNLWPKLEDPNGGIPHLQFFDQYSENFTRISPPLQQERVDDSIDILARSSPDYHALVHIWNLIKGMLRVNPEERPTANCCFSNFFLVMTNIQRCATI